MIHLLRWYVRMLAKLTLWRYRPGIVGVTGSAGKTSAKLAIATVLGTVRRVRASSGNMNNDLGLPLAILGDWSPEDLRLVSHDTPAGTKRFKKLYFWLRVIALTKWRIIVKAKDYPEILILEYGADRPGDIKRLLRIARPNVSVVTAIGETPVHVEFYGGPEGVAREKGRIIECLPAAGFAVLNYDDDFVMELEPRTRGRVFTYGFEKGAAIQVSRFENRVHDGRPVGVAFKIDYAGSSVPVRIPDVFGKVQAYAAAAAASVGLIFGMNLVKIAEALEEYRPADSRMQLLPGIKETFVMDDSYNASPISMAAALETLGDLPATRRIAVLGDMLEIGKFTEDAHAHVGTLVAHVADVLVTVGPRAKFIAEAAVNEGMKRSAVHSFDTADEAVEPLQAFLKKGDLVLVKGSHSMELNKVVEGIKFMMPSSSSLA